MKKILAAVLAAAMTLSVSVMAFAAGSPVRYYDESGNPVTINGLFYNSQGYPCYNAMSYYEDENGNPVFVGGCRAYYYDGEGNLNPGNYYYDEDGKAIPRGNWGCGMYYYNEQGDIVNQSMYYDDFGNPLTDSDVVPRDPGYGYGNCCGRW